MSIENLTILKELAIKAKKLLPSANYITEDSDGQLKAWEKKPQKMINGYGFWVASNGEVVELTPPAWSRLKFGGQCIAIEDVLGDSIAKNMAEVAMNTIPWKYIAQDKGTGKWYAYRNKPEYDHILDVWLPDEEDPMHVEIGQSPPLESCMFVVYEIEKLLNQ